MRPGCAGDLPARLVLIVASPDNVGIAIRVAQRLTQRDLIAKPIAGALAFAGSNSDAAAFADTGDHQPVTEANLVVSH